MVSAYRRYTEFYPYFGRLLYSSSKRSILLNTDQVGNVRLSFYKGANGTAEIDRVTNYPFGLEFNENIVPVSTTQNYRYSTQGQEKL
jgi:hypothetical protein